MKKLIYIILLFLLISGCKSRIHYIPITEKSIEYRDRLRIDSIHNSDTLIIRAKNDTIYSESIKWRWKYRTDTVSVLKVDSIPYPVEVIEYVNELNKWQRMRLNAFNILLGVFVVIIIVKFKKWI